MTRSRDPLVREFEDSVGTEPLDLASTALTIARIEYPRLDPQGHLDVLDELGGRGRARVGRVSGTSMRARVAALNGLIFEDERFTGNHGHYDDFRNSFLNAVLDRRLGIPITLALVYIEVARRAGVEVQGIAFPGHFLMRVDSTSRAGGEDLVLDPFDAGVELDLKACRGLLARHLGPGGEDAPFDPALLRPCTSRQMVARMLNNLKRTYVEVRSFQHARRVTDLLLALEPMLLSELRDRALFAYHLEDFPAALRDLEDYLRLRVWRDDSDHEERELLLDHVKTLKRRLASMN